MGRTEGQVKPNASLLQTTLLIWAMTMLGHHLTNAQTQIVSNDGQLKTPSSSTVYNVIVEGHSGVVESPNFPSAYLGDLAFNWTLKVARGNRINITFTHFATEVARGNATDLCRYDYLGMTESNEDEPSPADTELGRFCGTKLPPPIASSKDHVFLRFVNDSLVANISFRLEWVLEGCGGHLIDSTGTFTSPGYPGNYPASLTCDWLITAPVAQTVQLNVTDLHLERDTNCQLDNLTVWSGRDDSGTLLGSFCHTIQSPLVVTSTGNAMFVRFQSDDTYSSRGFKATHTLLPTGCGGKMTAPKAYLHSPDYSLNYNADVKCTWLMQVEAGHVVRLQFLDFDPDYRFDCSADFVRVYDGNSTATPKLLEHCGNSLPAPAQLISTGNQMLLSFKSDGSSFAKGFKANYSMACGARIVTDSSGLLDIGDAINADPGNRNCSWIIVATQPDARVTLTVTHLEAVGSCEFQSLTVRDGDSLEAPLIGEPYCGPTVPPALTSSGSAMTVTLAAWHGGHLGRFTATYSVASAACGGHLSSEHGSFFSPGYPLRYPADTECVWTLSASPGNRVQLSFETFDLAQSESCNVDHLEVREGDALGRLVGVYCTDTPANVSANNTLWIKFRSSPPDRASSGAVGGGFLAHYALVHGNELSGPRGQIASPLYPYTYHWSGVFHWRVTVDLGFAVSIAFSELFEIKGDDCAGRLEVYDGYDETASVMLRSCGSALPSPVTTSANVAFVRLATDDARDNTRFLLEWKQVSTQPEESRGEPTADTSE